MEPTNKPVPAVNPANLVNVRTSNLMTEKEKAESYLLNYMAEVQRGNRYASDLSDWIIQNLLPEAVKGLASDWDDSQADKPAEEKEGGENE